MEKKEIIHGNQLPLEKFLEILKSGDDSRLYPNNHIPTDEMMEEFLSLIKDWEEKEIKWILRKFLVKNGTFGMDEFNASFMVEATKNKALGINIDFSSIEYYRRLVKKFKYKNYEAWEGLTWVLDLLPHWPSEAIKVIDSFFLANCQFLSDTWLSALSDCNTIINAYYINVEHPREVFLDLSATDFEYLVASVYKGLEYEVSVTKASYDGGIDVCAEKTEPSKKEKIIIQCKRYTPTIGVSEIRNLLGVVSDTKATKGVLVTSSKFSNEAIKFSENNPSIELINHKALTKLLNEQNGPFWISKVNRIITNLKKELNAK